MTKPDDQETEDPINEAPCPELNEALLALPNSEMNSNQNKIMVHMILVEKTGGTHIQKITGAVR